MIRRSLALVAIAIPLTFAACGGDDDESTTSAGSETSTEAETTAGGGGGGEAIEISETEFKLDPSDPTAAAGAVTLNVANDGSITHNLELEGDGVEEVTDDLDPGASGELAVDLQPGTYKIYCTIGDHEEQGMVGELTVN